ncbi:MAG TPA: porin [Burkholderiaceae bacterium]|nr:porin [Burkholderiaceae bacterium]
MKTTSTLFALLAMAGSAFAQSSVTISGRIDLNVGKDSGASTLRMKNGAISNLTFSGTEDLGGGNSAFFTLSSRLNPDNGTINAGFNAAPGTFWTQNSFVGIGGDFGSIKLGRQFSGALMPQILADPWFWDNTTGAFMIGTGGVSTVWLNNAVTYSISKSGFTFNAQVADKADNLGWSGTANKTPYSTSLGYNQGPLGLWVGYEKPADGISKWTTAFASYDFGALTVRGNINGGTNYLGQSVRSWLASSTIPVGRDNVRVSYGQWKVAGVDQSNKLAAGYYHTLSKRTSIYANYGYDSKVAASKSAFELGVQHTF